MSSFHTNLHSYHSSFHAVPMVSTACVSLWIRPRRAQHKSRRVVENTNNDKVSLRQRAPI